MNVKKEIELAIKKENPNWDGESFDYGIAIYQNVLECWEAISPIIEKAGHSGFSYGLFCSIFKRVLDGKVLTPITDDDFNEDEQIYKESPEYLKERGLKSDLQCMRYSSLFRQETLDGIVSYIDVDRIVCIDQKGSGCKNGWTEKLCQEYIPQIVMPYYPSDKPIYIYAWQFTYKPETNPSFIVECGVCNATYIQKIVFPDGKVVNINKCYVDDKELKLTEEMFDELKKVIEEELENDR